MDYVCKQMFERPHVLRARLNDLYNTNLKKTRNQKGKTERAKICFQASFMIFGGASNDF